MVKQHRVPLNRLTLEVPAGEVEENETAFEAIEREIYEETGYRPGKLISVGSCRLMPNREDVLDDFFIGLSFCKDPGFKSKEPTEVVLMDRQELLNKLVSETFDLTILFGGLFIAENKYGIRLLTDPIEKIENVFDVL